MESPLKNLKKQVTCSICLETFTDPKTITCLHTFCCECLKKHALISQRNGKFRCPECQAEVGLPEANRFDKLPTSFHHNNLLDLLAVRQSGDGNEISCGICARKSAEISYCFECVKFMCSSCVNAHDLFKNAGFEGHKATPVKQFQAQDYKALIKRQSFCPKQYHEREVTRFFCRKCQTCVCQICIATDHKTHEVEPLEKAADSEKPNILARAELIKEKSKVCSEAILKFEQTQLELETKLTITKRQVSQAADQMIAKIREREREIITTLENTCVSRAEKLNSTKTQLQSLLKQINQAVKFAKNLVQRSSSSDIMQSKPNLEQRFEDLENTPVPGLPVNSFVTFVPTSEPESLTLGFIETVLEGLTQDFQAGVEAEFVVHLGIDEEQVYKVKCKCHVEVLVEPADKIGSLTTCGKEDGDFLVKFTPKVPGTFNITVKINGKKLATSPYTVQVKERLIQVVGELELKGETLQGPSGIAVNSKGLIAVADVEKHCILIFDKEGKFVRKLGCYGNIAGQLNYPLDVTFLNDDNILVADQFNHRIQQFNVQTGNSVKSFGKNGTRDGEFQGPVSLCMDGEGRVIVAEFRNSRVQVISVDGKPVFKFGDSGPGKLYQPTACIHHQNRFFVSDWGSNCLKVFDNSGKFLYKIGEPGKGDGQLHGPWGLCLEKCGNHYNLLVCNTSNGRVDQFTVEGCFTGKTVDKLSSPFRIATTPDGRILVPDNEAKKIFLLIKK